MSRNALIAARRLWPAALGYAAVLLMAALAEPVIAARAVRPFDVATTSTDRSAAFVEAMRIALVRTTGRRDADQDPAYAALLTDAQRYVQSFRPGPAGLQVVLDGAAIDRAVVAAGGKPWPRQRAVVLVAITPSPGAADLESARAQIESTAALRGLPVIVGANGGVAGAEPQMSADAALALARREGADALLLGEAPAADAVDPRPVTERDWSWRLISSRGAESIVGPLAAAVHTAADRLAADAQELLQQPEAEALIQIHGVTTLKQYAEAGRLLAAVPGVRSVALLEAGPASIVFRVQAKGGADGLLAALATSARLQPAEATSGLIAYRLLP
jgi:hypothetical protein